MQSKIHFTQTNRIGAHCFEGIPENWQLQEVTPLIFKDPKSDNITIQTRQFLLKFEEIAGASFSYIVETVSVDKCRDRDGQRISDALNQIIETKILDGFNFIAAVPNVHIGNTRQVYAVFQQSCK